MAPPEDNSVYFCYGSANDSFSGILNDGDEESSFDDQAIKEFIQYSRPELFERLHGLPFKSSDIPQSFCAQRMFKKTSQIQQEMDVKNTTFKAEIIPTDHACETLESLPQRATQEMLELQVKRYVLLSLLNGHSLVLLRLQEWDELLICSSPSCRYNGYVFQGDFYLTLKRDFFPNGYTGLREVPNQTFYCLECLEDIFDGRKNAIDDTMEQTTSANFDGVDHGAIMKAATRLYQANNEDLPAKPNIVDATKSNADLEPPTNRPIEFRLKRQQEIETTLIEVKKFEKVRLRSQEPENLDASPSLKTKRPWYMEAARDRYKKQGLGRYDKVKAAKLERERSTSNPKVSPKSWISGENNEPPQCYCREPDLGMEDMIRCTNEWCSIGWFHLRCTDLWDNPPEDARFVCKNCQDDLGPFKVFATDEEMDELATSGDLSLKVVDKLDGDESQNDTTTDDNDTDLDDEDTSSNHDVLPWGSPINLTTQLTISATDDPVNRPSTTDNKSTELVNPLSHLDGFTPINTPTKLQPNLTSHPTDSKSTYSSSLPDHEPSSPSPSPFPPPPSSHTIDFIHPLFPTWPSTTFTDLAPFITSDLEWPSPEGPDIFRTWKCNAPPSKLIIAMMKMDWYTDDNDNNDDDEMNHWSREQNDADAAAAAVGLRLSELLLSSLSPQPDTLIHSARSHGTA